MHQALAAHHLAVVGGEDDDRVVLQPGVPEGVQHLPDAAVQAGDVGEVEGGAKLRLLFPGLRRWGG